MRLIPARHGLRRALFAVALGVDERPKVDNFVLCDKIHLRKPKWRNWQTRYVQGVVRVPSCGFKSHLRHSGNNLPYRQVVLLSMDTAGKPGRCFTAEWVVDASTSRVQSSWGQGRGLQRCLDGGTPGKKGEAGGNARASVQSSAVV